MTPCNRFSGNESAHARQRARGGWPTLERSRRVVPLHPRRGGAAAPRTRPRRRPSGCGPATSAAGTNNLGVHDGAVPPGSDPRKSAAGRGGGGERRPARWDGWRPAFISRRWPTCSGHSSISISVTCTGTPATTPHAGPSTGGAGRSDKRLVNARKCLVNAPKYAKAYGARRATVDESFKWSPAGGRSHWPTIEAQLRQELCDYAVELRKLATTRPPGGRARSPLLSERMRTAANQVVPQGA